MKRYINYIIVFGFILVVYLGYLKFYPPQDDLPKLYKVPSFNFLIPLFCNTSLSFFAWDSIRCNFNISIN